MTLWRHRRARTAQLDFGGFTLIEALIALVILVFMLIAAGYLLLSTVETNRQARRISAAVALAQEQLERLRSTAYGSLAGGGPQELSESGVAGSGLTFRRSWTVANNGTPAPPPTGTRTLTVTVGWTDKGNNTQHVQFQTIVSE